MRKEQIDENIKQYDAIFEKTKNPDALIKWLHGDSVNIKSIAGEAGPFDFLFSCPPYGDLETYSDDPADLSNMGHEDFISAYRKIIHASCELLAENRFACFVVGDIRAPDGSMRNFVSDTISAFRDAGLQLYNEAVLVTMVGSLPLRVGRQFPKSRKLGKAHQNVLVFVKGDPVAATEFCGPVKVAEVVSDNSSEDTGHE